MMPKEVIKGRIPQLEKAIDEIMKQLKERKPLTQPADPIKVRD
jgi:hypothetical protein